MCNGCKVYGMYRYLVLKPGRFLADDIESVKGLSQILIQSEIDGLQKIADVDGMVTYRTLGDYIVTVALIG